MPSTCSKTGPWPTTSNTCFVNQAYENKRLNANHPTQSTHTFCQLDILCSCGNLWDCNCLNMRSPQKKAQNGNFSQMSDWLYAGLCSPMTFHKIYIHMISLTKQYYHYKTFTFHDICCVYILEFQGQFFCCFFFFPIYGRHLGLRSIWNDPSEVHI